MSFVTVSQLKSHLNLTADEVEFDGQLPLYVRAAERKAIAFLNRDVLETLPETPVNETDIAISEDIKLAILDVAAYTFDNRGQVDNDMVINMLDSYIGHLRIHPSA